MAVGQGGMKKPPVTFWGLEKSHIHSSRKEENCFFPTVSSISPDMAHPRKNRKQRQAWIFRRNTIWSFATFKNDFLKIYLILFRVWVLSLHICSHTVWVFCQRRPEEVDRCPRTTVKSGYELLCVCWEPNQDPLQEHKMLLTSEPFPQFPFYHFKKQVLNCLFLSRFIWD